jgi:hypothetical protein
MNPLLDPFERDEHECQCWLCAPRAFPRIPDVPTHAYVGVGHPFGRHIPTWARPKYQFTLWYSGHVIWPVERWVLEVMTGPLGWIVWMYPPSKEGPGSTHARDEENWPLCRCQAFQHLPGSPCMQISFGEVRIEEQPDNPFVKHPTGQNLLFSLNAPINRVYRPVMNVPNGAVNAYDPTTKVPLWWRQAKTQDWAF